MRERGGEVEQRKGSNALASAPAVNHGSHLLCVVQPLRTQVAANRNQRARDDTRVVTCTPKPCQLPPLHTQNTRHAPKSKPEIADEQTSIQINQLVFSSPSATTASSLISPFPMSCTMSFSSASIVGDAGDFSFEYAALSAYAAWDAYGACSFSEDGEDMAAVMMIVEA